MRYTSGMADSGEHNRLWIFLFAAFLAACAVYLLAVGFSRGHLSFSTLWPARWGLVAPINKVVNA